MAEVSWNDDSSDGKRNKNKNQNIRNGGAAPYASNASDSAPIASAATAKLPNLPKRNSISSNTNTNHHDSNDVDPLAETSENHVHKDSDDSMPLQKPIGNSMLFASNVSPQRKAIDVDETLPPVKKKRGRPPLDDDFDSYSTPKISHVESSARDYDTHMDTQAMYDDSSREHISRPSSILEQSMEVSMTEHDDAHLAIQPKIERPDTPASVKQDYYDDNDFNPPSPMDDPTDSGMSGQVCYPITEYLSLFNDCIWF